MLAWRLTAVKSKVGMNKTLRILRCRVGPTAPRGPFRLLHRGASWLTSLCSRLLEERYQSQEDYLGRVTKAAQELVDEGYLLREDLETVVEQAAHRYDLFQSQVQAAQVAGAQEVARTTSVGKAVARYFHWMPAIEKPPSTARS